jgi:hypothetical protein
VEGLSLSFKNCQAIERGYDLDELVAKKINDFNIVDKAVEFSNAHPENNSAYIAYIAGASEIVKALELMGDKKFSEEQLREAFFHVQNEPTFDVFKKSLQQTEWDVEVVMKNVIDETKIVGAIKGVKGSGNKITTYKQIPKLDADGCLILKRT